MSEVVYASSVGGIVWGSMCVCGGCSVGVNVCVWGLQCGGYNVGGQCVCVGIAVWGVQCGGTMWGYMHYWGSILYEVVVLVDTPLKDGVDVL